MEAQRSPCTTPCPGTPGTSEEPRAFQICTSCAWRLLTALTERPPGAGEAVTELLRDENTRLRTDKWSVIFNSHGYIYIYILAKQVHFHDYTFFYPQFTLIAPQRFPEPVAGRCEMLAI